MTEIMMFHDPVILTIPGIYYINEWRILGEIDDDNVYLVVQI